MDGIFLFGGRLFIPKKRLVALYDATDFFKYVRRKLEDAEPGSVDFFTSPPVLKCGFSFNEVCLTLIGISLEKNWGIPIAKQGQREKIYKHLLETCFGVSLHSVFKMPYAIVGRMGNVDIQVVELDIVDDYLVMVY